MMEHNLPNERMSFSWCLTIYLSTAGLVMSGSHSGFAMSYCSNSFRFDQLCPDPRTGPQSHGTGSQLPSDTSINLNPPSSPGPYRHGGGGTASYPSNSYGSPMTYSSSASVKDPSTNACDFHRNGVETDVITAIQVTENPWNFRHANPCNQFLKFNYAHKFNSGSLSETTSIGGGGGGGKMAREKGTLPKSKDHICQKEIGIRREGSKSHQDQDGMMDKKQPLHQEEANQISEEIARKTNVYFWHNFTMYPHSAEFVDTITNYHWSREDIACANERNARYVQIAVVVSKNHNSGGKCEILVQQYKINEGRSPYGCPLGDNPIPHQFPFCGSYDCAQSNSILTSLKLLARRDFDPYENPEQNSNWKKGGGGMDPLNEGQDPSQQKYNYDEGLHRSLDSGKSTETPCATDPVDTTVTSFTYVKDGNGNDEEEVEEPVVPTDWLEVMFLFSFPLGGVIFIGVVLNILRSKSGREMCRGYPYPRQSHHHHSRHSMYHQGSFASIDKNNLPI